ncbi:hypothetical protein C8Q69DRAFT_461619 [Paecilomyces variotii]|uniref:Uncharacterized protein n=1 Tax=Byssochlamys spectabilis TaxID=264951 RepID=A0A443HYH9_BYSSP|nr:hypothetical protein C8Q69DRAFT_461619 [Paecilomyces variotii]RWQ96902.1 hypothetical protein C8Q69DRAFT_461619 [Paecilomyces variotii]
MSAMLIQLYTFFPPQLTASFSSFRSPTTCTKLTRLLKNWSLCATMHILCLSSSVIMSRVCFIPLHSCMRICVAYRIVWWGISSISNDLSGG